MKKIYVGCSLTHATQEYRDSIEKFKETLRAKYEVMQFMGLVKGTGRERFDWDVQCVKSADFFIADVSLPSTGLGIELGVAYEMKKPVLLIANKDAKVALMVEGHPGAVREIVRYETLDDVLPVVYEVLG